MFNKRILIMYGRLENNTKDIILFKYIETEDDPFIKSYPMEFTSENLPQHEESVVCEGLYIIVCKTLLELGPAYKISNIIINDYKYRLYCEVNYESQLFMELVKHYITDTETKVFRFIEGERLKQVEIVS